MTAQAMPQTSRIPLWAGRAAALVAIILVSMSLRTAATSLSPIIGVVGHDISLDALGLGGLGMLPPVMFAAAGFAAPRIARRISFETFFILLVVVMVVGFTVRALAVDYWSLFAGTLLALAAAGAGNILLPPVVKRYFPDRIGLITSVYATSIAVGMVLPPALAFPIATAADWRVSLGTWALLALMALPPWLAVAYSSTKARRAVAKEPVTDFLEIPAEMVGRVWHSKVAWALAIVFSLTSFHAYALVAWLPRLLVDQTGIGELEAGLLLAFWGFLGMVSAIVAPVLAAKLANAGWLLHIGGAGFVIGYLGLLLAPGVSPWLWITFCGVGQLVFPACLALINLRTKTHSGSIALSGFVQGVGYLIAALGPLLVGVLHDWESGWAGSLILLAATAAIFWYLGFILRTPKFVEDETAARSR